MKLNLILSTQTVKYPLTGIGRYTYQLFKELSVSNTFNDFLCYDGKSVVRMNNIDILTAKGVSFAQPLKNIIKKSETLTEIYFTLQGFCTKRHLSKYEDYIVHSTNFICPNTKARKIVTFHDLTAFMYPECVDKSRLKSLVRQCEYTIKNADALVTVSHSTKKQIESFFNYPEDRIFVTPLGVTSHCCPRTMLETEVVLRRYGLSYKNFILSVGTIEPRKNLGFLIDCYKRLPKSFRLMTPLVICGHSGWGCESVHTKMQEAQSEGWLKYLKFVSEDELYCLYSAAKIFCFPSLYEGFGLPLLEAMASGTAVLTANNSSLSEVAGESALLADANNTDEWLNKIQLLCEDDCLLSLLEQKGIKHSSNYSWHNCALKTIDAYKYLETI